MKKKLILLLAVLMTFSVISTAFAAGETATRIKDIAKVQGVRTNQLVGYGLVVGLAGTGDSNKSIYTIQSIVNMLKNFGIVITSSQLQAKNVAAVMVTAQLPAFVKQGDTIDVTASSMGDAKSIQGGILLQTPLKAANGQVYAVGQGPVSTGGFSVSSGGSSQQKNFPTVGLITNGAIVEKDVAVQLVNDGDIVLSLSQPDFTTASRICEAIQNRFGNIASARDPGTVVVSVPKPFANEVVAFVASIEELTVLPDTIAKVIINERTGTIVMGANVTIDAVAVAQGGLTEKIGTTTDVVQPNPLSNGNTVVTQNTALDVKETQANLILLQPAANVGDVVNALNAVGATPRDIISILQAMKAAGALHADLSLI